MADHAIWSNQCAKYLHARYEQLFSDMLDGCVVIFLDDILIYSKTLEEHAKHVRQVLDRLRQHQFYVKLKKSELFKQCVTFLGHDISANGVSVN